MDVLTCSDREAAPIEPDEDHRKTALDHERNPKPPIKYNPDGSVTIGNFSLAQQILKSAKTEQAGFNAALVRRLPQKNVSVLFAEGEEHRRQRAATARFFTPHAVTTRYRGLITDLSLSLVERFRRTGRAVLDEMSLDLAAGVAAEIVGMTNSLRPGIGRRLSWMFEIQSLSGGGLLQTIRYVTLAQLGLARVYFLDVLPAIRARRKAPGPDLISSLIEQGWSHFNILTECVTYGTAGLSTTREFIVAAALHLLDDSALRRRFLDGDDSERLDILAEILRVEPAVSTLLRRTTAPVSLHDGAERHELDADCLVAIDIRSVNSDVTAAGACPHHVRPDRDAKGTAGLMSFGDGPHRCPGAAVALHEAAIFLEQLLRVPGIRLASEPTMSRNLASTGYVIRNAVLTNAA